MDYLRKRGFALISWKNVSRIASDLAKLVREFFLKSHEEKRNFGAGPGVGQVVTFPFSFRLVQKCF